METTDMKHTGRIIKELREKAGENQEQLAAALQVANRETVARWESGARDLKREHIIALAKHFNVSADYLLGLSEVASVEADVQTACRMTGLSEGAVERLKRVSVFDRYSVDAVLESDNFYHAIDSLVKYAEAFRYTEKRPLSNTFVLPSLGEELTDEERAKRDAQILLEECGCVIIESDYDKMDFYKQQFISRIFDLHEEISRRERKQWQT